jgi:hypothetical protein
MRMGSGSSMVPMVGCDDDSSVGAESGAVDDQERRDRFAEINERARRAFLDGAAAEWPRANGRPSTDEGCVGC